jgi:hypothetical protein
MLLTAGTLMPSVMLNFSTRNVAELAGVARTVLSHDQWKETVIFGFSSDISEEIRYGRV